MEYDCWELSEDVLIQLRKHGGKFENLTLAKD